MRTMDEARRRALDAKGPGYLPRTRHVDADGRPEYTNRLIFESSPYLLQHAHNPVDWYPWGDEAFERARLENKPVFLSIGYATCHWCHVMEEESFEDPAIAARLGERFIAVKVDREERPDVDGVYMTVVQAITGRGGWPMSVFLTPDREPFFAGTYFPPRAGARGSRQGFAELIELLADAYARDPAAVAADAAKVTNAVRGMLAASPSTRTIEPSAIDLAVRFAAHRFDANEGGARGAPKFPSAFPVRLLLRYAARTGEASARSMAMLTLTRMRDGGMHDQIGGGFHRYSTDARWLVPHFEKMLYDNALLASSYLEAGEASMTAVARKTLDYLAREMRSPEGTFYSATDADSVVPNGAREEGYYFTFTREELVAILGEDEAALAAEFYEVTNEGNFEGRTVLTAPRDPGAVALAFAIPGSELDARIAAIASRLYAARQQRPSPLRDEKVLVSWNALAVSAFATAAVALGDEGYASIATTAYERLVRGFRESQVLPHLVTGAGPRGPEGFVDDYAFLANAAIDVFELTSDRRALEDAAALLATLDAHFVDSRSGAFAMASDRAERLIAREVPMRDGAVPSGNSIAAIASLRLAEWTESESHRRRADALMRVFAAELPERAPALEYALVAIERAHAMPESIVVVVPEGRGALVADARPFLEARESPWTAVIVGSERELDALAELVPSAGGKRLIAGAAAAYVCREGTCAPPTADATAIVDQRRARSIRT